MFADDTNLFISDSNIEKSFWNNEQRAKKSSKLV